MEIPGSWDAIAVSGLARERRFVADGLDRTSARADPRAMEPDLARLYPHEPRLAELEREIDALRDDGSGPWFCSNFLWLPINTRLRLLIGVARLPQPGDEAHPELYDSHAYERVFTHLSRRLPPCRNCGCARFAALRTADV
jgi:hypothetical protein